LISRPNENWLLGTFGGTGLFWGFAYTQEDGSLNGEEFMMNVLKVIAIVLCFVPLTSLAQSDTQSGSKKNAQAATTKTEANASTVQATAARKPGRAPKPSQDAPDQISAAPGTVLTLCCGSLDPHSMAGENCAYMHTGQGCGGFILACPKGTSETVKKDGSGYCKED
jgi:hypothetical protein